MTITPAPFTAPTSVVASTATLGDGVRVWDGSHVEAGVEIGADTVIGRGVTVGAGVRIGRGCKVQNTALLYGPTVIADGVFIGPGAVLTNDHVPRAVNPDGTVKSATDWRSGSVVVELGASIGAGAICVAPVRIGRWAMVGAGAVVTRSVPDHALVAGVPARIVGWVGRTGARLVAVDDGTMRCPETGERYRTVSGRAIEVIA